MSGVERHARSQLLKQAPSASSHLQLTRALEFIGTLALKLKGEAWKILYKDPPVLTLVLASSLWEAPVTQIDSLPSA